MLSLLRKSPNNCFRATFVRRKQAFTTTTATTTTPVVIVGGGPNGLFLSHLLMRYEVPHVLLEAQTPQSRFSHPQAHFLNTRTMELLQYWLPHSISNQIREAMPPVEQYKSFRFGYNMSNCELARVIHPVDQPLQAGKDANGVLVQHRFGTERKLTSVPLSTCRVGHLAQHTFGRILYETALNMQSPTLQLLYETRVTGIQATADGKSVLVETDRGHSIAASFCVAADGAHSTIRRAMSIQMSGQEGIQHLMNIHVQIPPEQAEKLHNNNQYAMLYSIFNSHVVAMIVCHSPGEYIIQIPYFPPYQTPEEDFSALQMHELVENIFGPVVGRDLKICSIKPWTMSALIADSYYNERHRTVLVGDAAHVFPPAGGFGMNTGMQDVHNLAWKLAWSVRTEKDDDSHVTAIFRSYQNERRLIAQQNAALSVRNYHRLLQVTRACYLNHEHPTMLSKALDISPLPLSIKRNIFQRLLKTALSPLSWLQHPDSMYTRHLKDNLLRILQTGAGLPLLFPKFELGFAYTEGQDDDLQDWRLDTMAPEVPPLRVGGLVPHIPVEVISNYAEFPQLQYKDAPSCMTISLSNLPPQLQRGSLPTFVLLSLVNSRSDLQHLQQIQEAVAKALQLPVETVVVCDPGMELHETLPAMWLAVEELSHARHAYSLRDCLCEKELGHDDLILLIRPDGHVAAINEPSVQQYREAALRSLMLH